MKHMAIYTAIVIAGSLLFLTATLAESNDRIDPVCGMTITSESPLTVERDGTTYYFCSDQCKQAFTQNPAKYSGVQESTPGHGGCSGMKQHATGDQSGSSDKAAGCGGCPMKRACFGKTKNAASGESHCGSTRVSQVNNFHTVIHPLHLAMQSGDVQTIRNSANVVQENSNALTKADLPVGIDSKTYQSACKALQKSVKTFVKSCKKRSDERVLADFNVMHARYETLQAIVQ